MSDKLFECLMGNRFRMKVCENVPFQNPEEKEKIDLINQISDDYKSLHGMRPRMIKYEELTIEQLRTIAADLAEDIKNEMDREEQDEKQHQVATQNALTPKKWTVGDVSNLEEIHPDELEDFGDGYTNDSQRAFANSQATTPRYNDTKKANKLAAQGKYVVLVIDNVHCKATDAVLGQNISIHSVYDSKEEAYKEADKLNAYCDGVDIISPETIKSDNNTYKIEDVPFECVGANIFKLKQ